MLGSESWPDPSSAEVQELCAWIKTIHSRDPELVAALAIASPTLLRQLESVTATTPQRKVRRIARSLMRYLLRYATRPTPFGLFAGVAPLDVSRNTHVRWGQHHHEIALPAPEWIGAYAQQNADRADTDLMVVAAATVQRRGDRLVLPWPPHLDDPRNAAQVTVRRTAPVTYALGSARTPISVHQLRQQLTARFPEADQASVTEMLQQLVEQRLLISLTRPPTWVSDPVLHLLTHGPPNTNLERAHRTLTQHNHPCVSVSERRQLREQIRTHLAATGTRPAEVTVDTRLDADVSVPAHVTNEAAAAAAALAGIAPYPDGAPAWLDYHRRCLETYGQGAEIDLTELLASSGLGFPYGYRGSFLPEPSGATDTQRSNVLVGAAHAAALRQLTEVRIEDHPDLLNLATHLWGIPPPHVELRTELHAPSPQAVDDGAYTLWVTGVSRSVGVLTGRFTHLDGISPYQHLNLPSLTAGALPVQVLAPPLADTAMHVARTHTLASRVLVIDQHRPPSSGTEVFTPHELAVRVDTDHLRLVHTPTGRFLEPYISSALDIHQYTHPLARFLTELPRARTIPSLGFAWPEAMNACQFLPRLRIGKTILAPAQWRITSRDLTHPNVQPGIPLPERVQLASAERRLGLDLTQVAHRSLLHSHLDRYGTATLSEAPPTDAYGWCADRPHELVLPLGKTTPPHSSPQRAHNRAAGASPDPRCFPPGTGKWLSAHLHSDPEVQLELLDHISDLWHRLGSPGEWWFVRYHDATGPHVRLRLSTHTVPHHSLLSTLGCWVRDLQTRGLVHELTLHTYRPETGRYGAGEMMRTAEAVFVADSHAALAQLRAANPAPDHQNAFAAAGLLRMADGADADITWLTHHLPRPSRGTDRAAQALAEHILDHPDQIPATIATAWEQRDHAVSRYFSHCPEPLRVLPSLMHLHHNRAFGSDRIAEQNLLALVRSLGLSRHYRSQAQS